MKNEVEKEIWKECDLIDGKYSVSSSGRVRNNATNLIRKLYEAKITSKGVRGQVLTCRIDRIKKTMSVHRLVAQTFIPNPKNLPQVNHIDGNRLNNRVSNLEWCTQSENMLHAYSNGLNHGNTKLTEEDLYKVYNLLKCKISQKDIARVFNVDQSIISDIVNGVTYKTYNIDFSMFSKSYYTKRAKTDTAIIQQKVESGVSISDIAKEYKCSRKSISRLLR